MTTVITAKAVSELRQRTGAGMMDCKKALEENGGDMDASVEYLRKKGIAKAEKRADRSTSEGIIGGEIFNGSRSGVLVEVACETDFVARNEDFNSFGKGCCLAAAAFAPAFLNREAVDAAAVERERAIVVDQTNTAMKGKPQQVIDKAIEGRMDKFFQAKCFVEMPFVNPEDQNDTRTIEQARQWLVGKIGENIQIRRFHYMSLGG